MSGEVIGKLSYGQQLVVVEVDDREFEFEIMQRVTTQKQDFPRMAVSARFIKITTAGAAGYVFAGLVSRLKPIDKKETLESYFNRIFGQLKVLIDIHHDNLDKLKRIAYANGAILQEETGREYWSESLYIIPDVTVLEAYLLINRIHGFENEYKRQVRESNWIETHPTKFKDDEIVLQLGPLEEASIKRERRYVVVVKKSSD